MLFRAKFKKIYHSGFFQVFFANVFSYLVAFCGSILYARMLGITEFGLYSFANNIIAFFLLLNGFGAASGVLQFVSKTDDHQLQLSYLKYSLTLGILFNVLLSILILGYALFIPLPLTNSKTILIVMAFFPIGRLYIDVIQAFLRATQQNNLLAKFALSSNFSLLVFNILGILCFGLKGFIISTYLSYLWVILFGNLCFKLPNIFAFKSLAIEKKVFFTYSLYVTIGNAFGALVYILDIFILGYVVHEAKLIAIYKVATIIPFALNFIPGVISTFFYPYFAKNAHDLSYIKKLYRKLQNGIMLFSGVVSILLIMIAKPLITLIFGAEYLASVAPFQILMLGFFIVASFRILPGNILASLGKAKFALWLNMGIMLFNILLTYVLVLHYGLIGASIGVIVVYSLAAVISSYVLHITLNSNISKI